MPESRFPLVVSLACHDLRTPLATVYGFARTLTRAGELDDRTMRFLGMIEDASEQMTELLTYLRALSGQPAWSDVAADVRKISRGQ